MGADFFSKENLFYFAVLMKQEATVQRPACRAWRNSPESQVNTTCEYYFELRVIDELPNLVKRQNMFTNTGN